MSMRSILVHLANDADHMSRLKVAFSLARRFQGHMTCLYTLTPVDMPAGVTGRGASASYIRQAEEIAREKAARVQAEVAQWCADHQVSYEWTAETGEHVKLLARNSLYADLSVVTQSTPANLEELLTDELPDHLAMVSGGPALVLPQGYDRDSVGQRVLIAWKPQRSASRAIHDSLPLLHTAGEVRLLVVNPDDERRASAQRVAAWLAAHGLSITLEERPARGGTGETILNTAHDHGSDLVVMGGYSHSRLRELVMGGAARFMLSGSDVPILMAY